MRSGAVYAVGLFLWAASLPVFAQSAKDYYEQARALQQKADWDSSSAYFRESASIYYPNPAVRPATQEDLTAASWRIRCRTEIGRNYISKGQGQRAIDTLYDVLREARFLLDTNSTSVARLYNSLGQAHESLQNLPAALYHYQTSYRILRAVYGKDNESTALTAYNIGITYDRMARYDSALHWKTRATETLIRETGEKSEDLGEVYASIGVTYDNRGDYENALLFYQKAQAILTEKWGDKDPRLADLYNKMGVAYEGKGDLANASRYKTFALRMREQSGDPLVVESYLNLGVNLAMQGKHEEALSYYRKAQRLQEEQRDQLGLAKTYTNIGNLFFEKGNRTRSQQGRLDKRDLDSCVKYHEAALELRLKLLGAKHPEVAGSYNNLGAAYFKLGESPQPALLAYQKAMVAAVADFNDTAFTRNPRLDQVISEPRLLTALEGKSNALYNLAQSEKASRYGSKRSKMALASAYRSIELAAELVQQMRRGLRSEEAQIDLAERSFSILENALQLALTLHNAGLSNTEDLPNFYQKAFTFSEQIKGGALQQVLLDRKAKEQSTDVPKAVLEVEQKLTEDLALTQKNLATELSKGARGDKNLVRQLMSQKFDLKAAHDSLIQSLEQNFPDYYRRKYDSRLGTLKEIKEHTEAALNQIRLAQKSLTSETELQGLNRAANQCQEVLRETNRKRFEATHQKRRNLALQEVRAVMKSYMAQGVGSQIREARQYVASNFPKNLELRTTSILQGADTALARGQIQTALQTLETLADLAPSESVRTELMALIRSEQATSLTYRQLAAAERLLESEPSVLAAQAMLKREASRTPQPHALVEYLAGDSSLYMFYITAEDFRTLQIPGTYFVPKPGSKDLQLVKYTYRRENLDEEIRRLRTAILKQQVGDFVRAAGSIYETALQPVERFLVRDSIKELILVPDGSLLYVPFEALLTRPTESRNWKDLPYVLKQYTVRYTYNYTLVGDAQGQQTGLKSMLGLAPVFNEADQQAIFGGKIVGPLPASQGELEALAQLFQASGHTNYRIYTGPEARKSKLKSTDVGQFRILHLATHGFVYPEDPVRSGVLLYPDEGRDGMLYSGELLGMNLNADLVTLSACETGLGKIRKGEGIIGLTRGFLFAGARNVLVTLWPVADASTARLMADFYRHILEANASYAQALTRSKRQLLASDEFSAPFFWAPFILVD